MSSCAGVNRWIAEQSGPLPALPEPLAAHVAACTRCSDAVAAETLVRAAVRDHSWPGLSEPRVAWLAALHQGRVGSIEPSGSEVGHEAASDDVAGRADLDRARRTGGDRVSMLPRIAFATAAIAVLGVMIQSLRSVPTAGPGVPAVDMLGPPASMLPESGVVRYATEGRYLASGFAPLAVHLVPNVPESALASCSAAAWVLDGPPIRVDCPTTPVGSTTRDRAYAGPGDQADHSEAMALDHSFNAAGVYHPTLYITTTEGGVVTMPWGTVLARTTGLAPRLRPDTVGWGITLMAGMYAVVVAIRGGNRRRLGWAALTAAVALSVVAFVYSAAELRPTLDSLIGSRGLDPLNPTSALRSYSLGRVMVKDGVSTVALRAAYADGTSRAYDMPVPMRSERRDWTWDPLGRLRAEHRELPGVPFGERVFDAVSRVDLGTSAARVVTHPGNWRWITGCDGADALSVSPDGDHFMVNRSPGNTDEVWLVKEGSDEPHFIGSSVLHHGFTTDGKYSFAVVAEGGGGQPGEERLPDARLRVIDVATGRTVVDTNTAPRGHNWNLEPTSPLIDILLSARIRPGPDRDRLWVAMPHGVFTLELPEGKWAETGLPYVPPDLGPLWVLPDLTGTKLALACADRGNADSRSPVALCVGETASGAGVTAAGLSGDLEAGHWNVAGVRSIERLAWDESGSRVIVVQKGGWAASEPMPPGFVEILANGTVRRTVEIATPDMHYAVSNWSAGTPGWLSDERVLVSMCIHGGRRLVAVDFPLAATADAIARDVTPRLWDAWAALAPLGPGEAATVFLTNGRGSLWRAAARVTD